MALAGMRTHRGWASIASELRYGVHVSPLGPLRVSSNTGPPPEDPDPPSSIHMEVTSPEVQKWITPKGRARARDGGLGTATGRCRVRPLVHQEVLASTAALRSSGA